MCEEDGYQVLLFDAIVDHKRDDTVMTKSDQTFVGANGRVFFRQSTRGWKLCILWKDGSTTWQKLSDFKECYPVETAEYATARYLADDSAFNWWVNQILKKRDRIISLVKIRNTRYLKKTSKYGIELPKSVADAYLIDKKNRNTHWADAISKDMENANIAFDIMPDGKIAP